MTTPALRADIEKTIRDSLGRRWDTTVDELCRVIDKHHPETITLEHVFAGDGIEQGISRYDLFRELTPGDKNREFTVEFRGQTVDLSIEDESSITATVLGFTDTVYDTTPVMALILIRFLDDIIDMHQAAQ